MRYLLMICSDGLATPEKSATIPGAIHGWLEEMNGRGVRRMGYALKEPGSAVTVRVRDGQTLVSDGPFAETKEWLGGFDVIDAEDLDEAIEIAAKHPVSWFHSVEVRPFLERMSASEPTADVQVAPPAGRQRYMLVVTIDGIPEPDEVEEQIGRDCEAWAEEANRRGVHVFGHPLKHANTATTVRVRDGQTLLSDGPFAETKEFIAGFSIVDVASREEAIALAASHPIARYHAIEVRRFADYETGDRVAA